MSTRYRAGRRFSRGWRVGKADVGGKWRGEYGEPGPIRPARSARPFRAGRIGGGSPRALGDAARGLSGGVGGDGEPVLDDHAPLDPSPALDAVVVANDHDDAAFHRRLAGGVAVPFDDARGPVAADLAGLHDSVGE